MDKAIHSIQSETTPQRQLMLAVRKSGATKHVTAHIFRHSFATQLLKAEADIRTAQDKYSMILLNRRNKLFKIRWSSSKPKFAFTGNSALTHNVTNRIFNAMKTALRIERPKIEHIIIIIP